MSPKDNWFQRTQNYTECNRFLIKHFFSYNKRINKIQNDMDLWKKYLANSMKLNLMQ